MHFSKDKQSVGFTFSYSPQSMKLQLACLSANPDIDHIGRAMEPVEQGLKWGPTEIRRPRAGVVRMAIGRTPGFYNSALYGVHQRLATSDAYDHKN